MRIRRDKPAKNQSYLIAELDVLEETSYQLQGPTILVWEDLGGKDFALSLEQTADAEVLHSVLTDAQCKGLNRVGNPPPPGSNLSLYKPTSPGGILHASGLSLPRQLQNRKEPSCTGLFAILPLHSPRHRLGKAIDM